MNLSRRTQYMLKCLVITVVFQQTAGQTFNINGSSPYGIEGGAFTLTCKITGSVPPGVVVHRDDLEVCTILLGNEGCSASVTDVRYKCACEDDNRKLLTVFIKQITKDDDGDWKCRNNFGRGAGNILSVPVYYGPDIIKLKSKSTFPSIEGSDVSIKCSTDCKPSCNLTWYQGNTDAIPMDSTMGLLVLENINRSQAGTYACYAQNSAVSSSKIAKYVTITVYFGPDNITFQANTSSSDIPESEQAEACVLVTEGQDIEIVCLSTCHPQCNISWHQGDTVQSSDRVLAITNISRSQDGGYLCRVDNPLIPNSEENKTLTLIVNYSPSITYFTTGLGAITEGSNVTLICEADSRPTENITWSSSRNTGLSAGTRYEIPVATCQHTDNYTCTANNNIDPPDYKSIPVYVRCSPKLSEDERLFTATVGETITLKVNVIAYPEPTFTWIQTEINRKFNNSQTLQVATNNFTSYLNITVESSSYGVYLIWIENDVGKHFLTIRVEAKDPELTTTLKQPDYDRVADSSWNDLNTWIIVGCVAAILVLGVGVMIVFITRRKRLNTTQTQKEDKQDDHNNQQLENTRYKAPIADHTNISQYENDPHYVELLEPGDLAESSDYVNREQTCDSTHVYEPTPL